MIRKMIMFLVLLAVAEAMGWPEPAVVDGVTLAATDVKINSCPLKIRGKL
ncbi:MAG: hypothetical protein WC877_03395 [Dehalococcoidales bacterium]|jgi:hypothetical protein|nr:hypothetical protein [Candidatus Neomarinimicrobiota bacterium]MDD5220460.1 hypothetical protein [Candidatus Bipolaricaulis sp.]